jgi:3-hydroxybutyryl-CoA dehydrogenase
VSDFATVAVIGAGTMGHGIAQVAAQAGYAVRLTDSLPGAAERALTRLGKNAAATRGPARVLAKKSGHGFFSWPEA